MNESQEFTDKEKQELIEKIANLEQDKINLVEEIKTERLKKAKTQEQIETKEVPEKIEVPDPRKVVQEVLAEQEQEKIKKSFEEAKVEIKSVIRELSPDVDTNGLLYSKFEKELSKFNFSGLKSKEEHIQRMKEAFRLMKDDTAPSKVNLYQGADVRGGEVPVIDGDALTAPELKLIQDMGISKEAYLKQKAKRPTYVATLLKYRQ